MILNSIYLDNRYLVRSTNNDEAYYEMAVDYLHAIEHIAKLDCGFATVLECFLNTSILKTLIINTFIWC